MSPSAVLAVVASGGIGFATTRTTRLPCAASVP
jgi:hypothetical protein